MLHNKLHKASSFHRLRAGGGTETITNMLLNSEWFETTAFNRTVVTIDPDNFYPDPVGGNTAMRATSTNNGAYCYGGVDGDNSANDLVCSFYARVISGTPNTFQAYNPDGTTTDYLSTVDGNWQRFVTYGKGSATTSICGPRWSPSNVVLEIANFQMIDRTGADDIINPGTYTPVGLPTGSNLVNGNPFPDSHEGWTLGQYNWSMTGGSLYHTSSAGSTFTLTNTSPLTIGEYYTAYFDTVVNANSFALYFGSTSTGNNATGSYRKLDICTVSQEVRCYTRYDGDISVSNLIVQNLGGGTAEVPLWTG